MTPPSGEHPRVGYVVESVVTDASGTRSGVARVYVATEGRARQIAGECPGRTVRVVPYDEMPPRARENLERAAREGA